MNFKTRSQRTPRDKIPEKLSPKLQNSGEASYNDWASAETINCRPIPPLPYILTTDQLWNIKYV